MNAGIPLGERIRGDSSRIALRVKRPFFLLAKNMRSESTCLKLLFPLFGAKCRDFI